MSNSTSLQNRVQAPAARPTSTSGSIGGVALWGVIAAFALLIAGVFASEAAKHTEYLGKQDAKLVETQRKLESFKFGPNGNVAPEDRMNFNMLMNDAEQLPSHVAQMRGTRNTEVMIAIAAFAFAAGAGFLAYRNRPRHA